MLTSLLLIVLLINNWNINYTHGHINNEKKCPNFDQEGWKNYLKGQNPWNYFNTFSVFFQFQTFQLLVYQNVGNQKRQRNGKITYMSTSALVVVFVPVMSLLLWKAFDNVVDKPCLSMCYQHSSEYWFAYLAQKYPVILGLFLSVSLIQNQYLLFIAREFLLTIYDETKYQGVTKRVNNQQRRYSNAYQMNLTEVNTQQVSDSTFKTLNRTHMKLETKEQVQVSALGWLTISLISLVLLLPALRVNDSSYFNNVKEIPDECPIENTVSGPRLYFMSAFGAVEAALIYVMPAYLFRKMCTKFQYE